MMSDEYKLKSACPVKDTPVFSSVLSNKPRGRPQINQQNIPTDGPSHSKRSQSQVSPMTKDDNVTMSSRISKLINQAPIS